jgi:hypothetical protein
MRRPEWVDTVNLAPNESLDLLMDFTDPIIRGTSVFHCHLLKHEDKGMMAKILFQCHNRTSRLRRSRVGSVVPGMTWFGLLDAKRSNPDSASTETATRPPA